MPEVPNMNSSLLPRKQAAEASAPRTKPKDEYPWVSEEQEQRPSAQVRAEQTNWRNQQK